jgi:hypothetical protein
MKALSNVLRAQGENGLSFWCVPCGCSHSVTVIGSNPWGWNNNVEKPTFTPSVLVTSGHFDRSHDGGDCWCSYNERHPEDPSGFKCLCCHSYVTDGNIQYLNDCAHELAGQTVPLAPFPDGKQ